MPGAVLYSKHNDAIYPEAPEGILINHVIVLTCRVRWLGSADTTYVPFIYYDLFNASMVVTIAVVYTRW